MVGKIFVLEPNPDTQASLKHVLENPGGFEVRGSADAKLALRRIFDWVEEDGVGPDLVLTEFFPNPEDPESRSGYWLVCELLRNRLTCNIPVIFMGLANPKWPHAQMQVIALERGAKAFIPKPFALQNVLDIVTRYAQDSLQEHQRTH